MASKQLIGSLASISESLSKQAKRQVSMTAFQKNAAGAHFIGFLVDFSAYEFQLFVSLDNSKCSVFI